MSYVADSIAIGCLSVRKQLVKFLIFKNILFN